MRKYYVILSYDCPIVVELELILVISSSSSSSSNSSSVLARETGGKETTGET